MSTQALYRAWRPTRFHDAIGQEAIVTTLQNQVASGRVSHAYLFCGSRGTGKTTFAKILARAVNCLSPIEGDLCGVCSVCQALEAENNLDIVEIDAASNNGVDEIRDLRDKIKFPPQHGRYRVYIIDEVHMLSTGAFNALLKTLEEPPSHAIFILATTEPQKLPATILSRCQRYDFKRYTAKTIIQWLKTVVSGERADVSEDALSLIARSAEGGMRDALSLLDMCIAYGGGSVDSSLVREILGSADRGFLFSFIDHLLDADAASALRDIDALMRRGLEPQVFVRDVTQHLRALLLSISCGESLSDLLQTTDEEAERYRNQASRISRERLLSLLDLFLSSEASMKWASQPRIALEVSAARACLPEESLRLDALASRLELVEKKMDSGMAPLPPTQPAAKTNQKPRAAASKAAPADAPNMGGAPAPKKETPGDSQALWESAIKLFRKEPRLYSQLLQGRFEGIRGDTARIAFPKEGEIYMNMLKAPERLSQMEQLLSEAAGKPMKFQLELEGKAPATQAKQEDILEKVFDAFGRENVQVVDEP